VTDLNARLDTISESLEIAAKPQQEADIDGYLEWHDAVLDILDATPCLVAALRAVLDAREQMQRERAALEAFGHSAEIFGYDKCIELIDSALDTIEEPSA
jgi:ferritin-like metal-binding protein YciE